MQKLENNEARPKFTGSYKKSMHRIENFSVTREKLNAKI